MYKVGVQTKGLLPEKDIDEAFCMIHEAGFDCVDINIDAFLKNSDLYAGKLNGFFSEDINNLLQYFMQYRIAMEKFLAYHGLLYIHLKCSISIIK